MALSDVTDPKAVELALAEFDAIGRDAFLGKYGYGVARSYFVSSKGRRYDSKAVLGAAHGYQHPEIGPLAHSDFNGGEAAAVRVLRGLGFEVLNLSRKSRAPKHWALCANPNRYRIADAVRNLEIDLWNVGRSDVRAGDTVVLWQTLDGSGRRGVVAFATVLADPESLPDTDNPYWTDPEDGSTPLPRVPVRYDAPDALPLWIDDEKHSALLRSLTVAKAQGGTVFRLTDEQWEGLRAAVGGWRPTPIEEVEATTRGSASGKGQGYGLSAPERRAVELHAMRQAERYFKRSWPEVRDVSSRCSFDLLCTDGVNELRVEVKGTTTAGQSVVLTKNEVSLASEPGYALFVVREIELDRGELKARGGQCVVFEPWTVSSANIVPIQYRCELQLEKGEPVDVVE